jgi:CubicO group peptidase (beta-lactamase class C family)
VLDWAKTSELRSGQRWHGHLEHKLPQYKLPVLVAAAVIDDKILAAGAVGTRRTGHDIPVTLDDRFHIGSDTKPMTAPLRP